MESLRPRHLVLVRHGESEGDVRRKKGVPALKHPKDEVQTELGHTQSRAAGIWIAKNVLHRYGLADFELYLTSPLIRAKQSARSLDLSNGWKTDHRISERDRGNLQGMTRQHHKDYYPESYQQMMDHPFHWVPPRGESILAVSHRFNDLLHDIRDLSTVLMMTHRDVMWAAHVPLDKLTHDEVEHLDTDRIDNGQVFHYTNINPTNGEVESPDLIWKRSVNPSAAISTGQDDGWVNIGDLRLEQV